MAKKKKEKPKDKIRVGVIGVGAVAQIIHLPTLNRMPDVEIVAISDKDDNKMDVISGRYKIKQCFKDVDKLLQLDEIDAVHVCVPNNLHKEMTLAALSAGKHVLVEKPIGINHEEAKAMCKEAQKRKRQLMVGMNHRFRPDAMILKNFVEGNELGQIFYTKAGWLRRRGSWNQEKWMQKRKVAGGGVFMDLGIQMLDLSWWLMGSPKPISVYSAMYHHSESDVEDSTTAMIRFEQNIVLSLEVSWTLLMENDFLFTNIFGTKGGALLNPLRIHKEMHGNLVNVTPTAIEKHDNIYKKSYEYEIKHFVECIKHNRPVLSSGKEAAECMKILEAVYQSAKEGREVLLK